MQLIQVHSKITATHPDIHYKHNTGAKQGSDRDRGRERRWKWGKAYKIDQDRK